MDPDDLLRLWQSVRNKEPDVFGALVTVVELASLRLATIAGDAPLQLPPPEQRGRLWETGRMAYEVSLALTGSVQAGWGVSEHSDSEVAAMLISRLADAARSLPWPEYAPHALGAIRAEALSESKHDTIDGFTNAWAYHREARKRFEDYEKSLVGADKDYIVALYETAGQLALSEAGTACRTAERVISQWAELSDDRGLVAGDDEDTWIVKFYDQLSDGAIFGEASLARVGEIHRGHGLVETVDEKRMAQVTAYRQPGVMTARALLLLTPLCAEMERMGHRPPTGYASWDDAQQGFLARFQTSFELIGHEVARHREYPDDVLRSLAQLRLSFAWLAPGQTLAAVGPIDDVPCLASNPLDDRAIADLSEWLKSQDADGNAISSTTMPLYTRAVLRLATSGGRQRTEYFQWRRDYFELDRYRKNDGRRDRVFGFLDPLADEGGE